MAQVQSISVAADRVFLALAAGLEIEFGRGAGEALTHRFLEAENIEFAWDARIEERWIGSYETLGADEIELDRVRVLGGVDKLGLRFSVGMRPARLRRCASLVYFW